MSSEINVELVRAFFGFSDTDNDINVVLPSVDRGPSDLQLENYPLFTFNVSPDDVLSGAKVIYVLTRCYGDRVRVMFHHDSLEGVMNRDRVFIGGPPTHPLTEVAHQRPGHAIRFEMAGPQAGRKLVYQDKDRTYEVAKEERPVDSQNWWLTRDYCLLTRTIVDGRAEVVISGLRAYGQYASSIFLGAESFYEKSLDLVQDAFDFQILVQVQVAEKNVAGWGIEEAASVPAPRVCISYVREDTEYVQALAKHLRRAKIHARIDTAVLAGGDPWASQIQQEFSEADACIICFSEEYNRRSRDEKTYVDKEIELIGHAFANRGFPNNFVLPVRRSEDSEIPQKVKVGGRDLGTIQWINLFEPGGEKKLIQAIRKAFESMP